MLKVNTNIVGIGQYGLNCVNALADSGLLGFRTAVLYPESSEYFSKAQFNLKSKNEFLENSPKFFVAANTAVFVLVDVSGSYHTSLACEIGAIAAYKGGLAVAVAAVPSSSDPMYDTALENIEELHDVFAGVVRINAGYTDSFEKENIQLFETLSRAMNSEAKISLGGYSEMKEIFTREKDIYFAWVKSKEIMDSHLYNAKCLELKLCHQTYVDTANNLSFFYAGKSKVNDKLISIYKNPIEKLNIAFLGSTKTYISDNNPELDDGEFVFSVICSE